MPSTLSEQVAVSVAISPRTNTAAGSGSTVDLVGFNKAAVVFSVGASAGGAVSASVLESTDGVAWTVPAATSVTSGSQITVTSNSYTQVIGYIGTARYITVNASATAAASNSQSYSAVVVKSGARHRP